MGRWVDTASNYSSKLSSPVGAIALSNCCTSGRASIFTLDVVYRLRTATHNVLENMDNSWLYANCCSRASRRRCVCRSYVPHTRNLFPPWYLAYPASQVQLIECLLKESDTTW